MFGRPNVFVVSQPTRTEYVTLEVHEHRAPTDESVKLLREMEKAAKSEVIKSVHVGDTAFECVVHQHIHSMDGSTELLAIFSMNGKQMTARFRDWRSSKTEMVEGLRDEIARSIATEILVPALRFLDLGR